MASRTRNVPLTRGTTLVLLAGGRSMRMGTPKRDLKVGSLTLLEWMVSRLASSFADVLVCGASAPKGARAVADLRSEGGPLSGLEAGLRTARTDVAFVLAVDMPRASARLAELLIERCNGHDAAVPRTALAQPLCAAYSRSAASKISAFLDRGGHRATRALDSLDVTYVDQPELVASRIDPRELDDLDTPADYEAFIGEMRG